MHSRRDFKERELTAEMSHKGISRKHYQCFLYANYANKYILLLQNHKTAHFSCQVCNLNKKKLYTKNPQQCFRRLTQLEG